VQDPKTSVSITYQYLPKDSLRPLDFVQEQELTFEAPFGESIAALPIPAVGDSVVIRLTDEASVFKVITRHFTYLTSDVGMSLNVNIVVTELDDHEYLARIKQ
jgi:hypothetical protein